MDLQSTVGIGDLLVPVNRDVAALYLCSVHPPKGEVEEGKGEVPPQSTTPPLAAQVLSLYSQHFPLSTPSQRDTLLASLLGCHHAPGTPKSLNFSTCRTVALLHSSSSNNSHDIVVSAASVRVHEVAEKVKVMEVILFATLQGFQNRGLGGVLSSALLAKAQEVGCKSVVLRATSSSVPFWCTQGYKPYNSTSLAAKALLVYLQEHCLMFPDSVLMTRQLSPAAAWVEYSLGKCPTPTTLTDLDTQVPQEYAARDAPTDAEVRQQVGLFDNAVLRPEEVTALTLNSLANTSFCKSRRKAAPVGIQAMMLTAAPASQPALPSPSSDLLTSPLH